MDKSLCPGKNETEVQRCGYYTCPGKDAIFFEESVKNFMIAWSSQWAEWNTAGCNHACDHKTREAKECLFKGKGVADGLCSGKLNRYLLLQLPKTSLSSSGTKPSETRECEPTCQSGKKSVFRVHEKLITAVKYYFRMGSSAMVFMLKVVRWWDESKFN